LIEGRKTTVNVGGRRGWIVAFEEHRLAVLSV